MEVQMIGRYFKANVYNWKRKGGENEEKQTQKVRNEWERITIWEIIKWFRINE